MGAKSVFISYSHDSSEHCERVLALSDKLRSMGVDAEVDQYHVRPEHGWPRWCEERLRPENAKYVLVICTQTYRDRVENKVAADEGRGVFWEGGIIYEYIYGDKGNTRFVPVLFPGGQEGGIPRPLKSQTLYRINTFDMSDPGFERLYRELTEQPFVIKPDLGPKIVLGTRAAPASAIATALTERPARTTFRTVATLPADIFQIDSYTPAGLIRREAGASGNESAAGPAYEQAAKATAGAPRLSLLVLPFANIGGGPEQDYFVDGVTESLTTDLSRIRGSFVIGRNTAFIYKGKPLDLRQIGRELNVRYVLEGSVQRASQRMRINVQLINAESGSHLWAERFDKPVADLFDMQDEIVARLANTLEAQLIDAESRRAERLPNPDALDLNFQGLAWVNKGITPDNFSRARSLYDRALEIDPDNVEVLAGRAWVDAVVARNFESSDTPARLAAAEDALTRALSLAPGYGYAHMIMGVVHTYTNRQESGIAHCERALALNRNLANAHGNIGLAKHFLGHPEEVEPHVHESLRLSPQDTFSYVWLMVLGSAKFILGRDDEAVPWLRRSIDTNRNFPSSHFFLAAAYAYLGRMEYARASFEAGLAFDSGFTIERARSNPLSLNPIYLKQRERYYTGLRMAGVPEK